MTRTARQLDSWRHLGQRTRGSDHQQMRSDLFRFYSDTPLAAVSGLNGSGKTRLLSDVAANWCGTSEVISLHAECERMLRVLESRDDIANLRVDSDEFRQFLGENDRQDIRAYEEAICEVVGRKYELIECYQLDYSDTADGSASPEQTIPFFVVRSHDTTYTSLQMGLGELSTFTLFWRLARLRQQLEANDDRADDTALADDASFNPEPPEVLIALDEPDAYLPPQGGLALLNQMAVLCDTFDWSTIVSTHSLPAITLAHHHGSLWVLPQRRSDESHEVAIHSEKNPDTLISIIGKPNAEVVIFVEDESASALISAILLKESRTLRSSCEIFWVNGTGPLDTIRKTLPTEGRDARIHYLFCYDGDARATGFEHAPEDELTTRKERERDPRTIFLPTTFDPDSLLMSLANVRALPAHLAQRTARDESVVRMILDGVEGRDPHDWVNGLGEELGRQLILRCLPSLWLDHDKSPQAQGQVVDIIKRVRKAMG
ncbi:hypothetical protein [Actinomyces radicidentis]|uniref:hypothetical protein n=1 Tax=Actinomyces radicidentis TaxID=111015 RepID=UPI000ADF07C6|nr:hypothetical protein [Actinomyces radicidentis]